MGYLGRFYREHLKPYILAIVGGMLLLQLGAMCHGLTTTMLRYVFPAAKTADKVAETGIFALVDKVQASFQHLLGHLLGNGDALRTNAYALPALIVLLFFLKGAFTFAGTMVIVKSGIKATQALRERLFRRTLDMEPSFFHKHPVGELLQRCINDVAQVQGIASNQLAEAMKEITVALAMFITVMAMSWQLTLAVFFAVPLVVFPIQKLSKRIRSVNHRNMEASARLLQRLKEVFTNIRVVMGFAREKYEVERFHHQQHELYRLGMKAARASFLTHPIMEMVGGLLIAGMILFVVPRMGQMGWDSAKFLTYMVALYAFYDPIRRLTKLNNEIQASRASLDRIYGFIDREPLMKTPEAPKPVPAKPQALSLEGVRFSYNGKDEVLKGINLEVRTGETVALVGGSGGGKTTLVNLVPRFYDPTEGRIILDGTDLRDFDPRELRTRIGLVTQETLLFMDSIHDNIAYGKPASRESVIDAAKKAHAHDFISNLPQGYDTPLAEAGASVSGGQRQRLAIARALLQDPPILILDEATSALDTESERAVQDALEALMQDRTTLVIAHRLSTIQKATRICVLKHGQVVEVGRHDELLAKGGEYARLHALQFHEH